MPDEIFKVLAPLRSSIRGSCCGGGGGGGGGGGHILTDIKEGGAGVHIVTDIKVKGRNNLKGRNNSPT